MILIYVLPQDHNIISLNRVQTCATPASRVEVTNSRVPDAEVEPPLIVLPNPFQISLRTL